MSLPLIKKVPQSPEEWEKFHFAHYLDHKIILGVVAKKAGKTLHMPPIWPVPRNDFTASIAQFHQFLHQQMNTISQTPSSDMSQATLSTPQAAQAFIESNYPEHFAFHQLVGVPA